jgi:SAM-dependent methyltransferase
MSEDFRGQLRHRWASTARGWDANADAFRRDTMPVSSWMLEAIAPQPGHALLDLAAGIGDTGFLAAELIQPGGTLITSDLVPEMLSAAQRRAEALGVRNVRFRQIDAEAIDQPAASLDGVLCRWGYMLMADAEAALRDTRRVLRPGARVALAAWTAAENNPWTALPVAELVARGRAEPAPPDEPGQFAWAPAGVIAENLEAAGFVEYEIDVVEFVMRYPSARAWWETQRAMSLRVSDAAAAMDDAEVDDVVHALAEAAAPWTAADGSLALPASTWVAAATA